MQRRRSTETELWCAGCRAMHQKREFGKDKNMADGFARNCKTVVSRQNRMHHEKNREALNADHARRRSERKASPQRIQWALKKLLGDAARRAAAKGIEFALTLDDLLPPPTSCPVFGTQLVYQADGQRLANSASLDRFDSALGYTPNNVWIISWRANQIKNDATLGEVGALHAAMTKKVAGRLLDGMLHDGYPTTVCASRNATLKTAKR